MSEEYYRIDDVAKLFKVTRGAVYKWMRSGALPYVYIGQDRRITATALRAFVRPGTPNMTEPSGSTLGSSAEGLDPRP